MFRIKFKTLRFGNRFGPRTWEKVREKAGSTGSQMKSHTGLAVLMFRIAYLAHEKCFNFNSKP
jgi:hypothetical protein